MIIRHINIPRHLLDDSIRSCKVQLIQDAEEFQHYAITLCFSNGASTEYTHHHAEEILKSNTRISDFVEDIIRHQVLQEFKINRKPIDYEAALNEQNP